MLGINTELTFYKGEIMSFTFTSYKNPLEQANALVQEDDGLDELVDEFYGPRITTEWEGNDGWSVGYQKSHAHPKDAYEFMITKGDDLIDSWDEFIPIKRAQKQAREELLKRLRDTIYGGNK